MKNLENMIHQKKATFFFKSICFMGLYFMKCVIIHSNLPAPRTSEDNQHRKSNRFYCIGVLFTKL